mmetsp:Transcript_86645/g.119320  ORF Transcript_86645/g.119320 Transcript_86645/m.119320 type:complete len:403 (-) Transcript_86645:240-1448(-)
MATSTSAAASGSRTAHERPTMMMLYRAGDVIASQATKRRFALQHSLGAGAYGEVWLCREVASDRQCAVKLVRCDDKAKAQVSELRREAEKMERAVRAVGAFHVPDFIEASEGFVLQRESELRFLMLAMEYVEGTNLESLLQRGREQLYYPQNRMLLQDIIVALCRLHEAGIIHCDVKGANIMVNPQGCTYLCDFGCSLFVEDFGPKDVMPCSGTPHYMAPEVAAVKCKKAQVSHYDGKADVWSLGMLGYEMSTGETLVSKLIGSHVTRREQNPQPDDMEGDLPGFESRPENVRDWQDHMLMEMAGVYQEHRERRRPPPHVPLDGLRTPENHGLMLQACLCPVPEQRLSSAQLKQEHWRIFSEPEVRQLRAWVAGSRVARVPVTTAEDMPDRSHLALRQQRKS